MLRPAQGTNPNFFVMPTRPVRRTLIIWLENGSWVRINLSSGFCKRDVALYTLVHQCEVHIAKYRGAFHSTKISGNFGLKLNGTVRSNRKSFEKIGPPHEVEPVFWLDRSDRNGPFHLTFPTHSQSQYLPVSAVASNRPTEALASVISFTFVVYSHYKHS